MLIAALLLAAAPQAIPDGRKLHPITQCFSIIRGDAVIGATLQTVRAVRSARSARGPAWDVVVHQKLANGKFDLRDHFVLARRDLAPIAFDNRKLGKDHVRLAYTAQRITGTRIEAEGAKAINVAPPGRVWEGNLWGVTFGALPLAEGARFALPFYQYDQGFGAFTLTVTGSETVATPAGPVEAWTVDAGTDPARRVTYLIAKASGEELGTRGPGFGTRLGGDCRGLG